MGKFTEFLNQAFFFDTFLILINAPKHQDIEFWENFTEFLELFTEFWENFTELCQFLTEFIDFYSDLQRILVDLL